MRKLFKYICIPLVLFLSFNLISCTNQDKENSSNSLDALNTSISTEKITSLELLEVRFNRNFKIEDFNSDKLKKSLQYISKDYGVTVDDKFSDKPIYKLFITFNDDTDHKYVIELYPDDLICIFPWDGDNPLEYYSIKDVPKSYNLLNYTEYINPKTYK